MPEPSQSSVATRGPADAADAAIRMLADPARRAVIGVLGDAHGGPLTAAVISDRAPLDVTSRLMRDRIRELERIGVLEAPEPNGGTGWTLTPAGQDLHRLIALMSRIAVNAAGLPPATSSSRRDRVLGRTLGALADPVAVQILRTLSAGATLSPAELEIGCAPIPRRTVYRRLSSLVDDGVVVRTVSGQVPRTTQYGLNDDWRPAVAVRLLSAWWATRHPRVAGPVVDPDLEGLLMSILPLAKSAVSDRDAVIDWVIDGGASPAAVRLLLDGGRIRFADSADTMPVDATTTGDSGDWTAALVSGARDRLASTGDDAAASAVVAAVRAAALSYVR